MSLTIEEIARRWALLKRIEADVTRLRNRGFRCSEERFDYEDNYPPCWKRYRWDSDRWEYAINPYKEGGWAWIPPSSEEWCENCDQRQAVAELLCKIRRIRGYWQGQLLRRFPK